MPELFDQAAELPRLQLMTVFLTLSLVFLVATLDSTIVTTALPTIASSLNLGASQTWVGTSFLVASTVPQIISSRLSDIFGRKICMQISIAIFAFGNLMCGFAKNRMWLYLCRAVAGIGGGALNSVGIIVISDLVGLRERGKYMSWLGVPIGLGTGLGPEIGGALAGSASWRWAFWITVPPAVASMFVIQYYVPLKAVPGSTWLKLKQVDWAGSLLSLGGITMLLIPISSGGSTFAWSSSTSIALFVVGGVLTIAFVVSQRYATYPILPLRLFRIPTVTISLFTLFFVGIAYYGEFYMAPLYLQNVLGYSPLVAGAITLPLVGSQVLAMTAVGWIVKRWPRSKLIIVIGYMLWTAGQGGQIAWKEDIDLGLIVGMFLLQGVGFGLTSQTTLVLAQASCAPADRAVVSGARYLFRTGGGAVGLAICTAIIAAVFEANLPASLPSNILDDLKANGFNRNLDVTPAQMQQITHAYYLALKDVFIFLAPCVGICFVLSFFVKDIELTNNVGRVTENKAAATAPHRSEPSGPAAPQGSSIELVTVPSREAHPELRLSRRTSRRQEL